MPTDFRYFFTLKLGRKVAVKSLSCRSHHTKNVLLQNGPRYCDTV